MQHPHLLAFRQHHALWRLARLGEDRLHKQVGFIDEFGQLLAVGVEILNGPGRHARLHRGARHRRRDLHDQARIERFRYQIVRSEAKILVVIGGSDHIALLRLRQRGDGVHRRQLHLFVDSSRPDVERAAKNKREAEHVVDLIREVGAAGADDGVGAHRLRQRRHNFRLRVGQRQDERIARHLLHHFRRQHARPRAAEKDIGVFNHLFQPARTVIFDGVGGLGGRHIRFAIAVDYPFRIAYHDVALLHAERHQQVQAGDSRGARARNHQPHLANRFLDNTQPVEHCGGADNRRAVLVVVKYRDLHALAQLLLDIEALWRFDILQVDTAKSGLQCGDNVD